MITKELYVKMMNLALEQSRTISRAAEFIQFDNSLMEFGWKVFDQWLSENFSEIDCDTISWWLFECDGNGEIYDKDNNKIKVDTPEGLWEHALEIGSEGV